VENIDVNASATPTAIRYHQKSRILEVEFGEQTFELGAEYLRVYSPSAEVRGHGPGQEVLQVGKEDVSITAIEPVGHYAVKLVFSDGHDSGLYTFEELYRLGAERERLWQDYLARLERAGHKRKPQLNVVSVQSS
tara:strand:+ start:1947 stop:2351 length:405 start_codon:yes stop_codon:yes gene_type:complete